MTEFGVPAQRAVTGSNGVPTSLGNGRPDLRALTSPPESPLPLPSGRGAGLALIAMAALIGIGALALSGWEFARQHRAKPAVPSARTDVAGPLKRAVALLASSQSERIPLEQSLGRLVLVLDGQGRGLLVVRNLGRAPSGYVYDAWLVAPGARAVPVARFAHGGQVVWLRGRVAHGAAVAVTLERAAARAPTRHLRLLARRP